MMTFFSSCFHHQRQRQLLFIACCIIPNVVSFRVGQQPPHLPARRQHCSTRGSRGWTVCCTRANANNANNQDNANDSAIALNPLLHNIAPSRTVELFSAVQQLRDNNITVTSLCVGEPDYAPPKAVLRALREAIQNQQTRYTAVSGTLALRRAIGLDLQRRKNVTYDSTTELLVANGAKQAIYQALLATVGTNDQVLIPAPHWPYPDMVRLTGAEPVIVTTTPATNYLLTPTQLRETLRTHPRIKLLILCNPGNPTGAVYSRDQLRQLVAVLHDFAHVLVLSDEIYERLVFDDDNDNNTDNVESASSSVCFASFPGMRSRTMVINGFSKSHAMTGLRLGYLAAPAAIVRAATTIQSQITSCANSLSQAAGVAALTLVTDQELHENVRVMKSKRDYVLRRVQTDLQPLGITVRYQPQGAFYLLLDVAVLCENDTNNDSQLCVDLLHHQRLALVPGSAFGAPGTVRISYATSLDVLATAMDKLREYARDYIEQKTQSEPAKETTAVIVES